MCRRASPIITAVAAMVVVASTPIPAAGQTVAQQRRVVDSLARRWRAATAAVVRADSLAAAAAQFDTTSAGPLVVLTTGEAGPRVDSALQATRRYIEGDVGSAAELLRDTRFVITDRHMPHLPTPDSIQLRFIRVLHNAPASLLESRLVHSASLALATHADSTLQGWTTTRLFLASDTLIARRNAFVELVTSPANAAHRCFAGERNACVVWLGLDTLGTRARLLALYGPDERRALVQRAQANQPWDWLSHERPNTDIQACLAGSDPSCVSTLARLRAPLAPVSIDTRGTVLRTAVSLGGRDAYRRLLTARGRSVAAHLAAAAGVPVDSLVGTWRREVLAARPPDGFQRSTSWAALFWLVVFCGFGLRSTRWR